MTKAFSVTGAIAVQSQAHSELVSAIAQNRAVEIWQGNCRITTCANLRAAQLWIGKSKKYTVIQQGV
jgi:hypothetical protein